MRSKVVDRLEIAKELPEIWSFIETELQAANKHRRKPTKRSRRLYAMKTELFDLLRKVEEESKCQHCREIEELEKHVDDLEEKVDDLINGREIR